MRNPWQHLRTLPWVPLLQDAGLAVSIASLAEALILLGLLQGNLERLPWILIWLLPLPIAAGIGAVAVALLERFFPQVYINRATLWALLPCVGLLLLLKEQVSPVPATFVGGSYQQLVGVMVGIFIRGRRYC